MIEYQGKKHYTPNEAAEKLGTKSYTVRRWIRLGYIGSAAIGCKRYVSETDIEEMLKSGSGKGE